VPRTSPCFLRARKANAALAHSPERYSSSAARSSGAVASIKSVMPGLFAARTGAEVGDGLGQVIPALGPPDEARCRRPELIEMTAGAAHGAVGALSALRNIFGARGWPRSGQVFFEKYSASANMSSRSNDEAIGCMMSFLRSPA